MRLEKGARLEESSTIMLYKGGDFKVNYKCKQKTKISSYTGDRNGATYGRKETVKPLRRLLKDTPNSAMVEN